MTMPLRRVESGQNARRNLHRPGFQRLSDFGPSDLATHFALPKLPLYGRVSAVFTLMPASSQPRAESLGCFATTHWSVVLQAVAGDSRTAHRALSQLCQTYWSPINTYIRCRGYSPADADDLTQQFFGRFLEKQQYRAANPQRGRFRSFLLTYL